MTNDYYRLLLEEKWSPREWNGPHQYQDAGSKSLMMLPTDIALIKDKKFQSRAFLLLPMCFNVGVVVGPILGIHYSMVHERTEFVLIKLQVAS